MSTRRGLLDTVDVRSLDAASPAASGRRPVEPAGSDAPSLAAFARRPRWCSGVAAGRALLSTCAGARRGDGLTRAHLGDRDGACRCCVEVDHADADPDGPLTVTVVMAAAPGAPAPPLPAAGGSGVGDA